MSLWYSAYTSERKGVQISLFTIFFINSVEFRRILLGTRKSSCVNARGIPPAAYQVLLAMLGGRVPSPRSGGVPSLRSRGGVPGPRSGGGYLVPGLGGYPIPGLGGYPIPGLGGTPSHVRGYPIPGLGGTPSRPHSPAKPEMGYPPGQTWDGVPPDQTWDWVPPWPDLGWGRPPHLKLRWGTPSPYLEL